MNNKIKTEATIIALERMNNSYYGNPAWRVVFKDDEENIKIGRTAPNSGSAYAIDTYSIMRKYEITYHFTKGGSLYIDYVKGVAYDNKRDD